MKNGLILYLVGGGELPANFDLAAAAHSLGQDPDQTELVSESQGFFTVEDAWHFLFTRGCGRINLLVAEKAEPDSLKPLSPVVRLYG
ncbi:MAG: hypothetical protein QME75_07530 [Deltaproteobacteria bacterium]|nr:hypothetical protein [Deltaproteobacteria bacterium]